MERATQSKTSHTKLFWASESTLTNLLEGLETKVAEYNAKCANLQLVPETAKNANGTRFYLEVEREKTGVVGGLFGGVDVEGLIKPKVEALKISVVKSSSEARQELLKLLDMEETTEESMNEASETQIALEAKANKLEATYNREKEQQLEEEQDLLGCLHDNNPNGNNLLLLA